MKKVILDANAYSRFLAGEEDVLDTLSDTETVYMSIFVLGELYAGFYGGRKERQNKEILQHFLLKPAVKILHAGAETAEIFGQLKLPAQRCRESSRQGKCLLFEVRSLTHAASCGEFAR